MSAFFWESKPVHRSTGHEKSRSWRNERNIDLKELVSPRHRPGRSLRWNPAFRAATVVQLVHFQPTRRIPGVRTPETRLEESGLA
jgi:hypothetical protein